MPVDVLRVTGGQDHGAHFGLRGSSATIGRGPVMDIVLTDPRVSRRHARVHVDGSYLVVEDLASSAGTAVNGVAIDEPTSLALGDVLRLGDTHLTVVWTPTGSLPPPEPEPRVPATVAATPVPAPPPVPAAPVRARPEVLLPIACLALAAFAVVALWMPALGDAAGTDSLWSVQPSGLRLQALACALFTAVAAGAWLRRATGGGRVPLPAITAATAMGGGLVAGLPLFLGAVDLPGVTTEAGLVLTTLAGVAVTGCALAGLIRGPRGPDALPTEPAGPLVLAGGGIAGSLLAAVASPLTWISSAGVGVDGLGDGGLGAGAWLIPLTLAVAAGCALTVGVARSGGRRGAVVLASATTALAAAALAFATAAAITLGTYRMQTGLSLVLAGTAVAFVSTAIGTGALTLSRADGDDDRA